MGDCKVKEIDVIFLTRSIYPNFIVKERLFQSAKWKSKTDFDSDSNLTVLHITKNK